MSVIMSSKPMERTNIIQVENRMCPSGLEETEIGNFVTVGWIIPCDQGKPRVQQPNHCGGSHKDCAIQGLGPIEGCQKIPGLHGQSVSN